MNWFRVSALLLSLFSLRAEAHWDAQSNFGFRSYPAGAMLTAQGGWSHKLWGTSHEEPGLWKYGYLRPWLQLQSIGVTSRAAAEIEVFPVSVLGFAAGSALSNRTTDRVDDFNCEWVRCDGGLSRDYLRSIAILGAGRWVLVGQARYDRFYSNDARPFREELSALVAKSGSDDLRTLGAALTYKLNENWRAGVLTSAQEFIASGSRNESLLGLGQWSDGQLRVSISAGTFVSTHQVRGLNIQGQVTWAFKDGLGLLP